MLHQLAHLTVSPGHCLQLFQAAAVVSTAQRPLVVHATSEKLAVGINNNNKNRRVNADLYLSLLIQYVCVLLKHKHLHGTGWVNILM